MSLDLIRRLHVLPFVGVVGLASIVTGGCAMNATERGEEIEADGEGGASTDPVSHVDHSKVKRQSIGNCWLYATVSWIEALNKAATGKEQNTSESYLTYWHWFDQIANGGAGTEISTGGHWSTAVELVNRYGIMLEGSFIAEEAESEMSSRQASALSAINASLKDGALKESAARRDRALVRKELDKAWALSAQVVTNLDKVFGAGVTKTLDRSYVTKKPLLASGVIRSKDFAARFVDPATKASKIGTLADAIGTRSSSWGPRTGALAWQEVDFPSAWDTKGRRDFFKRIQRALHDGQPVIISWFVDFNALDSESTFSLEEIARRGGPGHQGGHMTVMHDYQVENVPGFGTLLAGVDEKRPEALEAALSDEAKITFIRIKNSWGAFRPDRWEDASIAGYHDLTMGYLAGPVKKCAEKDGHTDTTNCSDHTPLWEVVLPKGY